MCVYIIVDDEYERIVGVYDSLAKAENTWMSFANSGEYHIERWKVE